MFNVDGLIALIESGRVNLDDHSFFWSITYHGQPDGFHLWLYRGWLGPSRLENARLGRKIPLKHSDLRRIHAAIKAAERVTETKGQMAATEQPNRAIEAAMRSEVARLEAILNRP